MLATRTFLFSDLRDYTAFVENHGDAAAKVLISDYRRIVRAEIAKHEGAEVKTEGDSFYVVFPGAGAAVSAGLAVLREADRYSQTRPDRQLRVGIGIHAGEPQPHEGQYVGSAVIVAARLAQNAAAGELLVTDVVRALLPRDSLPSMEERTGLALKGIADPPRVFSVHRPSAPAPRPPSAPTEVAIPAAEPRSRQLLCPEIVGREAELAALDAHLASAAAGHGRTVLVGGEAGLGKTALLRRFGERAREHGARVLVGECSEIEARRPFGPVIDAFVAAEMALPQELAQGAPGAQPLAEVERYRVHAGFTQRLAAASAAGPIVLVIEDLQWGDEATYELVPYLARKLRDRAVLLVATYRTDDLHRTHPLNHVLAELARGRLAEEVRLRPLTGDELGQMVMLALGLERPATREFREALYSRTEGNPFFVEEILRALVEKGELAYREGSWRRTKSVAELAIPVSIRDAVEQRLLALTPSAQAVVQLAAVIGQRFEFDLLREIGGVDEETVFEAIRAAVDAQLLAEEPEAEQESYRFRHALSREAVLADMLARERRVLHKKVGEAIERRSPGRTEDLAYHFDEARDARAFRYHSAAAEDAIAAYAYARAVHHLERAIELTPNDDRGLGELYLRLSEAATASGDERRAERSAEQAASAFTAAGDEAGWADATTVRARLRWAFGEPTRARELASDAVHAVEAAGDSPVLARALAMVARVMMLGSDDPDATIATGERAAAMAHRLGDRGLEAEALISIGTAISRARRPGGSDVIRRAIALTAESGPVETAARAYNNLIGNLWRDEAPDDEFARAQDELLAHYRRYGLTGGSLYLQLTTKTFDELDWDSAVAHSEEADPDTFWGTFLVLLRALVLMFRVGPDQTNYEAAQAAARRLSAAGDPQFRAAARHISVLHELAGDHAAAAEPDDLGRFDYGSESSWRTQNLCAPAILRAAYELGDHALLKRWRDAWVSVFGERSVSALLGDAFVAKAERRDDDAFAALQAIAATTARRAEFYLRSVAAQQEAELLAARGDRAGARAAADRAREPFRKADATWYLAELDRWARALGIE
jgi:class 3 adenylate cyclase